MQVAQQGVVFDFRHGQKPLTGRARTAWGRCRAAGGGWHRCARRCDRPPQRVRDDRQGGVHRPDRGYEAAVDHVQVVQVVGPAVHVEDRGGRVGPQARRTSLVSRGGGVERLVQVEATDERGVRHAELGQHCLEGPAEPGEAFGVVAGLQRQPDRAVRPQRDPADGQGEVLAGQPEVDRVPGDLAVRGGRGPPEPAWCRALDLPVIGLTEHLDMTHRVGPVLARAVEVVEGQRFLEDRRVRLAGEGDEGQVIVPHVVPADQIGGVRQAIRMLVVCRLQQQGRRKDRPGRKHDDVGGERPGGAVGERDRHPGGGAAVGVGQQPPGGRPGHQPQVGMRGQGRADHGPFGVGLGPDQAGEPVYAVAPDAR